MPKPKEPLKPKEPPQPKAPLTAKKTIKTPDQLDPFDPNYDPLWKPPKPGVDFGAVRAWRSARSRSSSPWVPIVKYIGAVFAVGGLVVAAFESRRAVRPAARTSPAPRSLGRFLGVVALIIVVADHDDRVSRSLRTTARRRPAARPAWCSTTT